MKNISVTTYEKIHIIGAGAWGTALAQVLAKAGRDVLLYARNESLAEEINTRHENTPYLQGVSLDPRVTATAEEKVAAQGDLFLLATPAQHLRATLKTFAPLLPAGAPLINCAKGIEIKTGALLSAVVAEILPDHPYGMLSGPSFAQEVANGLPAAITLATSTPASIAQHWAEALHTPTFRPYLSGDPVGAEIAGALKNVIAIACGIVEGRKLGQNARAAVMTRGMAEIRRCGQTHGAQAETFLGLAGIGDLMLTCNSMHSRNFSLGAALGQGRTLAEIMHGRRTVAEGVATAAAAADFAAGEKIDMPICCSVNAILHENVPVDDIIHGLLAREIKQENL